MQEALLQLLHLQEVDLELRDLEKARDQYPAEIDQRQNEIKRVTSTLEGLKDSAEDLAKKHRQLERELEDSKTSLKQHEERFAVVTTNKEYDALQLEIEACKAGISVRETQILEIIETAEDLQEQIEAEKQGVEEVCQEQQSRIDELQSTLGTLQQEIDGVMARREATSRDIGADLLRVYTRRRKSTGVSVAAVRKGACGACFMQMPAQQKTNVRRNDRINFCENCGSILVWDDKSD